MISTKIFDPPAWNRREILRYARIRGEGEAFEPLLEECIAEAEGALSYRVCYTVLPADHPMLRDSKTICKAIRDAEEVILFAATVGAPFDRLIQRYSMLLPSKALMLQAIGAERVESLCDAFCNQMNTELAERKKSLTPRVSPGYGDIPLAMQKEIFALLDCPRKIGLTLDDSLLMSPSKSVTALAGIVGNPSSKNRNKCALCAKTDCAYRAEEEI